jgi:CHAT domain
MSLDFLPAEQVRVAAGYAAELRAAILDGLPPDAGALVLHDADADAWYVVPAAHVPQLQRRIAELRDPALLLDAPELQPATVAAAGAAPVGPAVMLAGDSVQGAWYEADGGADLEAAFSVQPPPTMSEPVAANGNGAAPAAGEPEIQRTPHMDAPADLPEPGQEFDVRVYTDTAPMRPEEEGEGIVIEAPADVNEVELGVLLTTSPGLEVVGEFFRSLVIRRDQPDAEGVTFTVRAGDGARVGKAGLTAQLIHRGRPAGRVVRRWVDGHAQALSEGVGGAAFHVEAAAPDLTLIVSAPVPDGIHYECSVVALDIPGFETPRTAPWALPAAADSFLTATLAGFVNRNLDAGQRRRSLLAAGLQLFGATPKVFQDALWALIDARAGTPADAPPATIFIASDEPLLPWEMMIPTRMRGGRVDDRPLPLGVEFSVGRWIRSDTTPPPQRLVVDRSFLIAATNTKPARVLDSTRERDVLARLYNGTQVAPATLSALDAYLVQNAATLLHFVCHGSTNAFDDTLYLDEDEQCTSGDIRVTPGFAHVCANRMPLVFLNACDAGRTVAVIGGGRGFPRVFTDLGARGVIAPLWPVAQTVAAQAAVQLYEAASREPERTIADLLRDVRRRSYEGDEASFEDSYASYCFFGDPCTRLEVAS